MMCEKMLLFWVSFGNQICYAVFTFLDFVMFGDFQLMLSQFASDNFKVTEKFDIMEVQYFKS